MELVLVTGLRVGDIFTDVLGNRMKLLRKEPYFVVASRLDNDKHDLYANCASVYKEVKSC